jgi:hypothetical protein
MTANGTGSALAIVRPTPIRFNGSGHGGKANTWAVRRFVNNPQNEAAKRNEQYAA